ncbi:MAG TPA: L-aspartate oxidase [Gammaproteobacteria bacterium]|nr:L-aspartate oxidase [Gammaproteobacteria bacterium]
MSKAQYYQYDVIIIGSGAAGLSLALQLPEHTRIALICKDTLTEGSTYYAQGGVAAVFDKNDSVDAHKEDTLATGDHLSKPEVVSFVVEQAVSCIEWLRAEGVMFTEDTATIGHLHLTQEAGHSHRRVVHAADATGRAVSTTLARLVKNRQNIDLFSHHLAIDLIKNQDKNRCIGAYVYDMKNNQTFTFAASNVVLATGGASRVYLYSTNPSVSSGDGIAMAWRAGCRVANLEFNQFHPTCLFHPHAHSLLLTEAIRGEGGVLRLPNGERFLDRFDPRAELAPRDIVARAIDHEMKRLGCAHVYLDISHKPAQFIRQSFPNLYQRCLELGLDMTRQGLPVVPAAHYTCGGVMTNVHGLTDLPGLYAIGEVAHTGLHGANRMASNSLLECLVFARAAAQHMMNRSAAITQELIAPWDESKVSIAHENIMISHNWEELRRIMWNYVGIVRSNQRLKQAHDRIAILKQEVHDYYARFFIHPDLIELRNLVTVADLMLRCAMARRENRGLHYNIDLVDAPKIEAQDTVLSPH